VLDPSAPGASGPGASGPDSTAAGAGAGSAAAGPGLTAGSAARPVRPAGALRAIGEAGPWVRAAATLSAVGILAHVIAVTTRGLAVHRAPWGDMYEFITALTCVAAIFFYYILVKYRAWAIGVFVMGAIVIALGLAETLIYTPAGPLVPALQSYWLSIHVTAMTLSSGIFFVAAVLGIMYIVAERYRKRVAAGKAEPNPLLDRIPSGAQLDKLTYRAVVFGFPIWTFGVMAGAIWADQAWGRYWGWDPVETWAFITWVIYAAYLHARATGGWRGIRSHYIQLLGFASLLTNIFVIQIFVTGLHSYAGVQ
jgi:cytochrome c-type biogenesis protein CcsB